MEVVKELPFFKFTDNTYSCNVTEMLWHNMKQETTGKPWMSLSYKEPDVSATFSIYAILDEKVTSLGHIDVDLKTRTVSDIAVYNINLYESVDSALYYKGFKVDASKDWF